MSLYHDFNTKIKFELKEKLWKKNIHQVPKIDKVIVSMGIGSLATRKWMKDFSDLEKNLMTITGQKPQMIKSKKSISNFKLRENMPMMLKVTLRRDRAYDFIERLVNFVLPRGRDFQWLSIRKFDGHGNYNIWFQNQTPFAEIVPEEIVNSHWIQVNIATTADTDEDSKQLLKSLGIIFAEKK